MALGARSVTLIGFDGYENATQAQQELAAESQALLAAFRDAHPNVEVTSGTRTRYELPVVSLYSRIANAADIDAAS